MQSKNISSLVEIKDRKISISDLKNLAAIIKGTTNTEIVQELLILYADIYERYVSDKAYLFIKECMSPKFKDKVDGYIKESTTQKEKEQWLKIRSELD